jgi:copper chaperone CopZ
LGNLSYRTLMGLRMRNLLLLVSLASPIAAADKKPDPKPERFTYKLIGLFSKDREADLRKAVDDLPDIKLVAVNFDEGEFTVEFVPSKVFPGTKPDQLAEAVSQKVGNATRHTFSVKPRRTVSRDKLKPVTIPVAGLDCNACCLAAYEIVARIDGVEQATASFKDGKITALIDPTKTDQPALEDALRKRGVDVTTPGLPKK